MIYEFLSSTFSTILEMFKSGGIITYIITIIGIYGILASFEKIRYLRKISKVSPPLIMGRVNEAMEKGGSLEALRSIGKYRNPISKIISEALKIGYRNKIEVEDAMERVFIVEMERMTKGLSTIKMITEVAPLLGLIGTVLGMWYTFKALGVGADPAGMAERPPPAGQGFKASQNFYPYRQVQRQAHDGVFPPFATPLRPPGALRGGGRPERAAGTRPRRADALRQVRPQRGLREPAAAGGRLRRIRGGVFCLCRADGVDP